MADSTELGRVSDPLRDRIVLPNLRCREDWPQKPGIRLFVKLVEERPASQSEEEIIYAAALASLANEQRLDALTRFRSLVAHGAHRMHSAHIALAGCMLGYGEVHEAATALEDGIPHWKSWLEAWDAHNQRVRDELDRYIFELLRSRAEHPWEVEERWDRWGPEAVRELLPDHPSLEQEALDKVEALKDFSAPRAPAGALYGFDDTLCELYRELEDPDAVPRYTDRWDWPKAIIHRAFALWRKGLPEAATLALDDYIRRASVPEGMRSRARYLKATILFDEGHPIHARRELARLYADDPYFDDFRQLRVKLTAPPTPKANRAPIPEEVRHTVWRRDEGNCVECGSRENLEFDHIIPLSQGGSNTERNLQLLCEPCNRRKGATI
jgi:HNH endonuclease